MEREIAGISMEIQRKDIKNMYLRVKPGGRVSVSVPRRMSMEEIEAFVRRKQEWIGRQQERLRSCEEKPLQYVTGETVYVWGIPYTLEVERGAVREVRILSKGCLGIRTKAEDGRQEQEKLLKDWYREILRMQIEQRLPVWESAMGLYCEKWQLRDMRSRWGSCNTASGRLCFALQLAEKPVECLDYILVHELAHLAIPDHSPRFWALVGRYVPDWQRLRKMLR
ncbi:MAG: M48 family metallopeptidase [Blautia sp.]|jgi:predicted metal-dependent hydrolase